MKVTAMEKLSLDSVKLSESAEGSIKIKLAAIHNGLTRNLTHYTDVALQNSNEAWTKPYEKKVLKNHDIHTEPLGRIVESEYGFDERAKKNCTYLVAEITDQDAIQKIRDKRYTTVSVGGSSESVICSICGTNIAKEGWCEHYKGEEYDGKLCFWNIESFEPEEISFVNSPADVYAGVEDIVDDTRSNPFFQNDLDDKLNLSEEANSDKDKLTRLKIEFSHSLLHSWWNDPENADKKEEIKSEHDIAVKVMAKYGIKHDRGCDLDD